MSFGYDPEAIYQEADIAQAEAVQQASEEEEMRRRVAELVAEIGEAQRHGRDPQRQLCELASIEEMLGYPEEE